MDAVAALVVVVVGRREAGVDAEEIDKHHSINYPNTTPTNARVGEGGGEAGGGRPADEREIGLTERISSDSESEAESNLGREEVCKLHFKILA